MILTCALSGALASREQCPAIPYTPAEYAAEARRAVDEGAVMVHLHARRPDGAPSYAVEDFRAITEAIRAEVGEAVIVNYSTGALGVPVADRVAYLRALRPEVGALNMGSMNYAKYSARRREFVFAAVFENSFETIGALLEAMVASGIRPEHECFDSGHVASLDPLLDMGVLEPPLSVSFVMGVVGGIRPTARNVAHMAEQVPDVAHQWGVIGISRAQWGLLAAALSLGGNVRVGLEDNFYLPDGTMARSNGELVARAARMAGDAGRRLATVDEARAALGLGPPGAGEAGGAGSGAAGAGGGGGASGGEPVIDAFFLPLGDGRFAATERTTGPWDPRHQHAGPPSALLAGELERAAPRPELVLARITIEILGPIPIAELDVTTVVERPGRSVELLAGELCAGGRPVLRARAWRVRGAPVGTPEAAPAPPLPEDGQPPPAALGDAFGYAHAVEWRWASGGWEVPGPAEVWTRLKVPIVAGSEPTGLQRVLAVADSGNGTSAVLSWTRYVFINTELTVHVLRPAGGEWVCLQSRTDIAQGGAGLASSVLSDEAGPVARGAQALFVAER